MANSDKLLKNRYKIKEKIGFGAFGKVYVLEDSRDSKNK